MKYIGKIQRVEVTKKKSRKHFDWLKLIIWYIGVIISLVPIFMIRESKGYLYFILLAIGTLKTEYVAVNFQKC